MIPTFNSVTGDVGQGKGRLDWELFFLLSPLQRTAVDTPRSVHLPLSIRMYSEDLAVAESHRPFQIGWLATKGKDYPHRCRYRWSPVMSSSNEVLRRCLRGVVGETAAAGNEDAIPTHPGRVALVLVILAYSTS